MKKILIILILSMPFSYSQAVNEKKNIVDTKKTAEPDKEKNIKPEKGKVRSVPAAEANLKKQENRLIRGEHKYIADFIEKEYVKGNAKKVEKLEKDLLKTQRRIQVTTNPKQKETLTQTFKKQKAELESLKIWSLYHKAYSIKVEAMQKKNVEKYTKSKEYLKLLEKKYQELTAQTFPNVRGLFYEKYNSQIKKMREQKLK